MARHVACEKWCGMFEDIDPKALAASLSLREFGVAQGRSGDQRLCYRARVLISGSHRIFKVSLPRAKVRVLLADDNPQCLRMWAGIVMRKCDIVATAKDGHSALELIRRLKPSVAVLDFDMPGQTGIDVLYELATQLEKPAVVICSVDCSPELIAAAREAGALGFVAKLYSGTDLLPAIEAASQLQPFFPPNSDPVTRRASVRSKTMDTEPITTLDR